jgi:hypothetical protein
MTFELNQYLFKYTWSFQKSDQDIYYHQFIYVDKKLYYPNIIPCELLISENNNSRTYLSLPYSDKIQQHNRVDISYNNLV